MNCKYCGSEINQNAFKCPICGEIQTYKNFPKIGILSSFVKIVGTLLFISLMIWWATNLYVDKKQELESNEKAKNEIIVSIGKVESSFSLMYRPCIGISQNECINQIELANKIYQSDVNELQSKIISYYPELFPTVYLLQQTNYSIVNETFTLWSQYFQCTKSQDNWQQCMQEKNRSPIVSVEVAKFIIEYLSAKIQIKVSNNDENDKSLDYLKKIIKTHEHICLDLPKLELEKFNGWRTEIIDKNGNKILGHLDFQPIYKMIWNEYLVPGSGLNVDHGYENMIIEDENKEIIQILKRYNH